MRIGLEGRVNNRVAGFIKHSFFTPDLTGWDDHRRRWTRDITRLMALVILIAAVIILGGTLAGFFDFQETIPIYILVVLIVPVAVASAKGGWRWAAYFPALLCYALGVYSSINTGFDSIFVLAYALAVLVGGILVGSRTGGLVFVISILSYIGFGLQMKPFVLDNLASIITFFFLLFGIALLQWYSQTRLKQAFAAQIDANNLLKAEIERRRQAELAQRDQQAQLSRLADNATDMIAEMDANGILRYASPSYRVVLGYDPAELVGSDGYQLIHPDERKLAFDAARQAAESHSPKRIRVRARHTNGHFIHVEISGNPLYDDQGSITGFVLASRDISQEKEAEAVIEESERKFRNIIESLPLGIHMYTLQEDGELVLSDYNPAADIILKIDHTPLVGKTIETAFPGLIASGIPDRFREIALSGGRWDEEQLDYSYPPIQGTFEVNVFQYAPRKIVDIFTDVTQHIQADEALRVSEEKFANAFLTSPDAININRLADGVYIDVNQGFGRLTGYSRQEVIGKSSLDLNIWADPADRARLVKGLLEKGGVDNLEAHFQRKNGNIGTGLMSARVIIVQGEKCILSVTRDITERIQAEVDLREAHFRLEQAYTATLQGWAHALELRERETADHSRRVVDHTLQIARTLKIEGDALIHMQRGALLHDIGKMGVPDEILMKPGKLTPDEWVTMRQHTDYAKEMLSEIDYLRPSIDIPYGHHEKWDGSGYPQGLKGKEIPLPARIFAIVDVYDALTHDRPYRPAWPVKEARVYVLEQRGKHFDPEIVDIFLEMISAAPGASEGI
jgi:PAS domain S-box-containing protein